MTSRPGEARCLHLSVRIRFHSSPLVLAAVLGAVFAGAAWGQMPAAPEINLTTQGRGITLSLSADNSSMDPGGSVGETRILNAENSGPFIATLENQFVGDGGARAYGLVSHKSSISTFKIDGDSHLGAEFNDGSNDAQAYAEVRSEMAISFTVPVDAAFDLSGTLEANSSEFSVPAQVSVIIAGTHPDGSPLYVSEQATSQFNPDPVNFFHTETVKAGTPVTLQVQAVLQGGTQVVPSCMQSADFVFELNLGDEDGDGLLDAWETDGIDVNNDGQPDIDLPAMGADPQRKDLFVELDALSGAWQSGDMQSITEVITRFDAAPAALIDNPDNSLGVNLHVDVDETNVSFIESGQVSGIITGLGALDSIKRDHFGSPSERQLTYWSDLKEARLKVYRYCVWALLIAEPGGRFPTGQGETPGNDFIVAADRARSVFSPADLEGALAGTFMHELGHTLGLHHGGDDTLSFKPNYLSVMNYMYQGPFTGTEDAFYLDYSTTTLDPLYEKELDETQTLHGPPYKRIMYNSAPDGQTAVRSFDYADAASVDWNRDGALGNPVRQNISGITPGDPPDQFMLGSTDWNHLWYHLSGDVNFEDGLARDPASIPAEIPGEQLQAINETPYVDLTQTTGVADRMPNRNRGLHPWPNPFSPRMTIRFELERPRTVDLAVYNVQGQRVRVLKNEEPLGAGPHDVAWNGTDDAGRRVPGGLYFVRMQAGDRTEQVKVLRVD